MPASEQREIYMIELRPLPGVNGVRALRSGLKALLRYHRLKAVRVWRLPDDDIQPTPKPKFCSNIHGTIPFGGCD